MKTISITAAMLLSFSANVLADERPSGNEIKVRAQYVMPQAEQSALSFRPLFDIKFPAPLLEAHEPEATPAGTEVFRFKNPEAITEEGLTEKAFQIAFPEPVIGDPAEIKVLRAPVKFQFKNPEAITEEGLSEKAFRISYPTPVVGSAVDIQADELKLLSGKG